MELSHKDGKLYVNYGNRLVTLLREVRQLTALGFAIPAKIQHAANVGQKFYRHGGKMQKELDQSKREAEISAAKAAKASA